MPGTGFTVEPEVFVSLSSDRAVKLFRQLLWAESGRVGIGRHLINVPDCINVGDGGVDAYIDNAHPSDDDVIPEGSSVFQVKSTDLGPKACRRELHVDGNLNQPLKDEVDLRLQRGAAYILVLMADITDAKIRTRCDAIRDQLGKSGYLSTTVRVYSANQMAGFTNRHPSLVASLRPELSTCYAYERWGSRRDVRHPATFVADSHRQTIIDQITGTLRERCRQPVGPWVKLLKEAVAEYALETGGAETSLDYFIEWLAEWGREFRRRQGGLLLTTAHRAKGLEFDHVVVLDGAWDRIERGEDRDSPRRLYYVAMTRARQTLTLMRLAGRHPFQDALQSSPSVLRRPTPVGLPIPASELNRSYRRLSLGDVFLSFAGYRPPGHPVHLAIAALSTGDLLHVRKGSNRWELLDGHGTVVVQLASSFKCPVDMRLAFASVLAIATWDRDRSEPEYRDGLACDRWEVVVPELVFEQDS